MSSLNIYHCQSRKLYHWVSYEIYFLILIGLRKYTKASKKNKVKNIQTVSLEKKSTSEKKCTNIFITYSYEHCAFSESDKE